MSLYYFPNCSDEMEPPLNLNNIGDVNSNPNNSENIDNTDNACGTSGTNAVTVHTPKYIHCGDGIVEYYSDDEENEECVERKISNLNCTIDTSQLNWGPWLTHHLKTTGKKVFDICDNIGEKLAYSLWITSPKYLFEIDEYKRMQEEKKKHEERTKGWVENNTEVTRKQPAQNQVTPV